jgi:hypothetical protein
MEYSTYVTLQMFLGAVGFGIIAAMLFAFEGPAAIGFVVLLGLVVLLGVAMSVAWAHRAVTEYRGSPYPGVWGILGVRINADGDSDPSADDGNGPTESVDTEAKPGWGEALIHDSEGKPSAPEATGQPGPVVSQHTCPSCGRVTEGEGTQFCRWCGARLATT